MSISKYCFAVVVAICTLGSLHAGTGTNHKKIYVNKDSIEFCEEGIRAQTQNGVVTTKAIHVNKKGTYFLESEEVKLEEKAWYNCRGRGCNASFPSTNERWMHERICRYMRR